MWVHGKIPEQLCQHSIPSELNPSVADDYFIFSLFTFLPPLQSSDIKSNFLAQCPILDILPTKCLGLWWGGAGVLGCLLHGDYHCTLITREHPLLQAVARYCVCSVCKPHSFVHSFFQLIVTHCARHCSECFMWLKTEYQSSKEEKKSYILEARL